MCEGDLPDLYWRYSFYELRRKLEIKYGEIAAKELCSYNSLVSVISQALGGKDEEPEDLGKAPTVEAAVANINALLMG